jgi:hypothetical protein
MKEITLSLGKVALVDDDDFERVNAFKWYASNESRGTKFYAIRRVTLRRGGRRFKIRMHRFIMGLETGFDDARVVDHLQGVCILGHVHTGDSLDNRKCGLRITTQEENMKSSPNWKKKGMKVAEPCL